MNAEYKKIIESINKRQYAPVYLIDGEESYYLDKVITLFEDKILQPSERDFNLSVLYGRDVSWADVVNACRRFPMFAERQVVILKDAAAMNGFNELAGYLAQPSSTTVLLIEYRNKKADARSKVVKHVKEQGLIFTSDKIKETQMPQWIQAFGDEQGFRIGQKEADLLSTYLGNDLQKIANEIEKIRINVPDEKELNAALIQKYIGISREYNIFEFTNTFSSGNKEKMYRILNYFIANPKAAPMALLTVFLYNHFNTLYKAVYARAKGEKDVAAAIGVPPFRVAEIMALSQKWPLHKVESCLNVLSTYNGYSMGINNRNNDTELLKEMVGKLELIESMN